MLGLAARWWFIFLLGIAIGARTLFKYRPIVAVGACAAISLLAPTWVTIGTEPFVFDVRLALACVLMLAYCFHPLGTLRYPQHWLDGVVLGLILVHILSDVLKGGAVAAVSLR